MRPSFFFSSCFLVVLGLTAACSTAEPTQSTHDQLVGDDAPGPICEHAAPPQGCTWKHVGPGACDDQLECVVAPEKACAQTSDCVAYESFPCCSREKDTVNRASLAAAEQHTHDICMLAGCSFDPTPDTRTPTCKAGACTLE